MSVKSSIGATEVTVEPAMTTGAYIRMTPSPSGHFVPAAVETLIHELAATIGQEATLAEAPKPATLLRDLEPGTAFKFGKNKPDAPVYVKLTGDRLWSSLTKSMNKIGVDSVREVTVVED